MTSTPTGRQARRSGSRSGPSSTSRFLLAHLERFWPSRRGHAFDELCR